ncbi:MAG: glycoside hydrolase family 97 protein [Candidatus Microsaccharimonas sp.]
MGNDKKQTHFTVVSPQGTLTLNAGIEKGRLWYSLLNGETTVIEESRLALFDTQHANLLAVHGEVQAKETSFDETWEQPWGEQRLVHNNYNELSLHTADFIVRFRLFDDSLGFRYELLGSGDITIAREETEFNVDVASHAWWIPALGGNHYEHLYKKTVLSEIDTAHTPLTIELPNGTFTAIHEAALYDYGAMNSIPTEKGVVSAITPLQDGTIAQLSLPFTLPWRTVIVSATAAGLGNSKVMLNLNEPSKIQDTSWIKPMKFMGIWWGMFIGYYTWASGEKHGATTRNALRYLNAAKELGIAGLLIEGWNETWDGDWTKNGEIMNHMQPYPDFDIHTVSAYAKKLGIELVGHHETSGNISHYEWELPEAYDYYKLLDVQYIKTGYVAPRMNTGDFHSSQVGVRHYQKTVELSAERNVMLDIHEPVKGTGIERTWPNLLTREGVMGQEYEGGAVTPEHTAVLPFTRLLAGPLDYTPGLFNLSGTNRKVQTTLAKQLAFYVTMYSPMQMVADLPEHYESQPAFQFIKDVPVNWETTVPLEGVIGDYYLVARKDRHSDDWYVGGVTDETARTVTVNLNFLQDHRTYTVALYRDTQESHWKDAPEAYEIEQRTVTSLDSIEVYMASGGGFAMSVKPADETPRPYPQQP